jgi:hypothetical protein
LRYRGEFQENKEIAELNKAIEQYIALDFSIIPLKSGEKIPEQSWKEYQKRKASVEEIFEWYIEYGIFNIGIVTGKVSKLVVIDCDSPEESEVLKAYVPEVARTAICKTNRGFHYYFRSNGERIRTQRILVNEVAGGIELKGEGSYVVAPPSTIDKVKREWLVGLKHLQQVPDRLLKILKNRQEQTSVWRYKGEASCISQILNRDIQRGERDLSLFILYNLLIRNGNSKEYARKLVEKKNSMLREPLSERELEYVFNKDYPKLGCGYVISNLEWVDCEGCRLGRRREKMSLRGLYKAHEEGKIDINKVNLLVYTYLVTHDLLDNLDELNKNELAKKLKVGRATIYRTLEELAKLKNV